MILSYSTIAKATALLAIFASGGYLMHQYATAKEEAANLRQDLTVLRSSVEILEDNLNESNQRLGKLQEVEAAATKLRADVGSLRKSIAVTKTYSLTSPEACDRSVTTLGEVFGECTEQYSEVARKAELLRNEVDSFEGWAKILPLPALGQEQGN